MRTAQQGERTASIAIFDRPGGVGLLNFALVLPHYRGRGAGRDMMQAALDHAFEQEFWTLHFLPAATRSNSRDGKAGFDYDYIVMQSVKIQ
ncbi:GNAT family N-acetyltransferase [Bordetella sp. BOR01]|uniref:GNAT family N-acetyltransferase n=1 Tax=Bordetella sp. BOR01 TaxID=2854779 RepID=UPI001C44E91A|nr:GNAT family N-acetyltransferase [Bordetella sp. BOR01]